MSAEVVAPDEVVDDDPDGYGRTGEKGDRAEPGKPLVRPVRLAILVAVFAALTYAGGAPLLVVVACILVMIFLHELGHFVMARRAGMKVTEFMIGFGPRIFSFRRGDVEFGLKAIPAGAYVKIIGMANIEEVPESDEQQTYRQKGYFARLGVAVAGSTMHFLLALILIAISFVAVGKLEDTHWKVNSVSAGSAASLAGVRKGDQVTRIGTAKVATFDEMATAAQQRADRKIPVEVLRHGKPVALTATITQRFLVDGSNGEGFQAFGNGRGGVSLAINENSRIADAGLRDSDVLTAVDGVPVTSVGQVRNQLDRNAKAGNGQWKFTVVHAKSGAEAHASIDLGTRPSVDKLQGFFGVGSEDVPQQLSVVSAVPEAFRWFGSTTVLTLKAMGEFFNPKNLAEFADRTFSTAPGKPADTGVAPTRHGSKAVVQRDSNRMLSIVGAVRLGKDMTAEGWGKLLAFLAFLNMAIGILNLVPLPPFDGGHVAVATYEKIREMIRHDGKRYFADYNKVMPVALAVVSVMVILGMMAIYLDIADPIRV